MEDVKAKGCPDPPTLEECLDELEKLAINMMNGEYLNYLNLNDWY